MHAQTKDILIHFLTSDSCKIVLSWCVIQKSE
jgi:hypothetical protein